MSIKKKLKRVIEWKKETHTKKKKKEAILFLLFIQRNNIFLVK